jgi:hypothetical protein
MMGRAWWGRELGGDKPSLNGVGADEVCWTDKARLGHYEGANRETLDRTLVNAAGVDPRDGRRL